jgi:hypothetical protein
MLVDGPVAVLVDHVLAEHPDVAALVATPGRRLVFRTFAAIRVGVVLGETLTAAGMESADAWVDEVAARPDVRSRLETELRTVAERVAADPRLAERAAREQDRRALARPDRRERHPPGPRRACRERRCSPRRPRPG